MSEYIVWRPDCGQTQEDGRHVNAYSSASAAEAWAQKDDAESANYHIASGTPAEVMVVEVGGLSPVLYEVSGESQPVYRAYKLIDGEAP